MYQVFLGLGTNLGDRLENLSRAVDEITKIGPVDAISSIYETEPVGMEHGDNFLNMVLSIKTSNDPPLLLVQLKKIEKKIAGKTHHHMEPRIIDIDILMYRGLAYDDHTVNVPHPRMHLRKFVLEPLNEIAPTSVHPTLEKTTAALLRQCRDKNQVVKTDYQLAQMMHQ
ncbi:MAG: 2-amino-4-hydroxy-6-hydroxymethyldihydropteridine diphosphokinase [Ignavibacteriales bacterium]|nr:2-amino-4-hydroxy-6-hydroxymethyldihydropteridine diphosphokinase [Ignavibacteriales bacterium]